MSDFKRRLLIIALIGEVDYDIQKSFHPDLSEEPDDIEDRMTAINGVVESGVLEFGK